MSSTITDDPHAPVTDEDFRASLGVSLQPTIDSARRIRHDLGLRPYRAKLIWQERGADRNYKTIREIELVPVRVSALDDVDLNLSEVGLQPEGSIVMDEISPNQVTEDDLRGRIDGKAFDADGQRFFYEVVQQKRSADDPSPKPQRYIPSAQPFYNAEHFWWQVILRDQEFPRGPGGVGQDANFNPDKPGKLEILHH